MSQDRDSFSKTIQSVFLFFVLFGLAAYAFVYVTDKLSGYPDKVEVKKPTERLEDMTDPSSADELVYKLGDNGSVAVLNIKADEKKKEKEKTKEKAQEKVEKTVNEVETVKETPKSPEQPKQPVKEAETVKKDETAKPVEKPVIKPVEKTVEKQTEKPKPTPPVKTVEKTAEKPMEKPKPTPAKAETVKPVQKQETAKAEGKDVFVLQLAAYKSEDVAKVEMAKLKKYFPDIYYIKIDLGSKGVWYRLRATQSQTYDEAAKKRDSIKAQYKLDPIVVKSAS